MEKKNEKYIKLLAISHVDIKGNPIYSDTEYIGISKKVCAFLIKKMGTLNAAQKKVIGYDQVQLNYKKLTKNNPDDHQKDIEDSDTQYSYRDN